MNHFVTKFGVCAALAAFAVSCSDDSSSNPNPQPGTSSASEAITCDLSAYAANSPLWTGAYFIYASGAVTDGATQIGTFDASTGYILDPTGATIAQVDASALPYFDGTNLIYQNCAVTAVDGTPIGIIDANGQITDGTISSSSAEIPENSSASVDPTPNPDPTSSSSDVVIDPTQSSSSVAAVETSSSSVALPPPGTYANILNNGQTGWSSRYWDACKPHCSWPGNVDTSSVAALQADHGPARNCNINDYEIPAWTLAKAVQQYWKGYQGTNSACDYGKAGAFTCTDMAPVAVNDTLAYAFVAGPGSGVKGCGKCYHLQFNGGNHDGNIKATHKALKGKHMVVMSSNIGHDVEEGQFDMMVPGGGVGQFDALTTMVGASSMPGAQYGGFLTACQQTLGYDAAVAKYQDCVIEMCNSVFANHSNLLRGCKWFAEWYMAADNPTYNWEEVECPQYLIEKYSSTLNTVIETNYAWQDDWSTYTGGALETKECSATGCP